MTEYRVNSYQTFQPPSKKPAVEVRTHQSQRLPTPRRATLLRKLLNTIEPEKDHFVQQITWSPD